MFCPRDPLRCEAAIRDVKIPEAPFEYTILEIHILTFRVIFHAHTQTQIKHVAGVVARVNRDVTIDLSPVVYTMMNLSLLCDKQAIITPSHFTIMSLYTFGPRWSSPLLQIII